jgi:uncharacterized protein (DUF305 family)
MDIRTRRGVKTCARRAAAALLIVVATAAAARADGPQDTKAEPSRVPAASTKGDPAQQPYSAADVHFMSGMIPHHAQAVLIAGWAASHGARPDVRILCERIVVGQRDEIALMQGWLRDRNQKVPEATATHMKMSMNGMEHDMLMPGMLTEAQLAELDKARGPEFDRLFLTFMITHHEGAITMVEELLASYGAAQDDVVFKFSSDIVADQSTEIERMHKMLAGWSPGRGGAK